MIKHLPNIFLFYLLAFGHSYAIAQSGRADSIRKDRLTLNMINNFNKTIGQQSRLYNGLVYTPAAYSNKTNANYKDTASFAIGNVTYDDVAYNNVALLYDINLDLVVTRLYNDIGIYSLVSEKVSEFDLLGHHFIRMAADTLNKQIARGFYSELYHGRLQVLARYNKSIQEESSSVGVGKIYVSSVNYFVKKGNTFYNVNSEGKFYDALKDKKKELKQYLKSNKIKFGEDKEKSMAILAAYYDHLTN